MNDQLQKIPIHLTFDEETSGPVNRWNTELQDIRDERTGNNIEAERIVSDALNGIQPAGELIQRTFALAIRRLAVEMNELKLAASLGDVEDVLRAYWKAEGEKMSKLEQERRAKLEKLADELGYANPSRERHQFILMDTERRRLEEAVKSSRSKANEHLDHETAGAVMARCENKIRESLNLHHSGR